MKKISKIFNDFVYFIFPFINSTKKLLHFLHFKLIITLLTCLITNIFFESLVNDTFSNLRLNVFIITGSFCSNKYAKRVVLINHRWVSSTLQRGWGLEFCLFSKKWGRVHFSPKKTEVGKIVEEAC